MGVVWFIVLTNTVYYMKTIKILAALFIFVGFSSISASAQSKAPVRDQVTIHSFWMIGCVPEIAEGDLTISMVMWDSKYQEKVEGTFVGVDSGTEYSISYVGNMGSRPNNTTQTATARVRADGKLIGVLHITYHLTFNANGELTAVVDNEFYTCD